MTMLDLRYVKKLVEMLDESSVDSIEISSDKGMKIRISKTPQQRGALQVAAPMAMPALLPAAVPAAAPPAEANPASLEEPKGEAAKAKYLKVSRPPTLRVDGHMVTLELPPLRQEDLRSLAEQIMAPKNIKEFSEAKESDFALAVPGIGRFRVNAYQQRGTIAYALRTVPFQAKTIAELNLPDVCERIALMPRGLILVTGITGSGKSTALASMLHYINQNRHANIITI